MKKKKNSRRNRASTLLLLKRPSSKLEIHSVVLAFMFFIFFFKKTSFKTNTISFIILCTMPNYAYRLNVSTHFSWPLNLIASPDLNDHLLKMQFWIGDIASTPNQSQPVSGLFLSLSLIHSFGMGQPFLDEILLLFQKMKKKQFPLFEMTFHFNHNSVWFRGTAAAFQAAPDIVLHWISSRLYRRFTLNISRLCVISNNQIL